MNGDKVRPFFRILALVASVPGWLSVVLTFATLFGGGYSSISNWTAFIGSLVFSGWLLVIAVTGKAPSLVKNLLSM